MRLAALAAAVMEAAAVFVVAWLVSDWAVVGVVYVVGWLRWCWTRRELWL